MGEAFPSLGVSVPPSLGPYGIMMVLGRSSFLLRNAALPLQLSGSQLSVQAELLNHRTLISGGARFTSSEEWRETSVVQGRGDEQWHYKLFLSSVVPSGGI